MGYYMGALGLGLGFRVFLFLAGDACIFQSVIADGLFFLNEILFVDTHPIS